MNSHAHYGIAQELPLGLGHLQAFKILLFFAMGNSLSFNRILWSEQPLYFQALYVFDRINDLAPKHPEWKGIEPFASVLKGDVKASLAGGEKALLEMTMATHAGLTAEEFADSVKQWLTSARHPVTKRPFTEMVFQPMLEVLDYLREHDFKIFIVSGEGMDFVRVFSEEVR
ncbi:MAG: haloacid dehalogenase-like hydrolase [Verrucomicrobiae bacterium]|nr:haloacid dehalogenase-like hydrolase [Verrucomicrobiae bacterium]